MNLRHLKSDVGTTFILLGEMFAWLILAASVALLLRLLLTLL